MDFNIPDYILYILSGTLGWSLLRHFTTNRCLGRIEEDLQNHKESLTEIKEDVKLIRSEFMDWLQQFNRK